jgi:DNA-binding transcriptional regulator YhcF (GntR family)
MLNNQAFKDLSPLEVRIYMEIKKRYNGSNNGEISLSCREAAEIGKCGKDTAGKAMRELARHGFIKYNKKGKFTNRRATTFTLTCERLEGKPKTDDWKYWPKNIDATTEAFMPD